MLPLGSAHLLQLVEGRAAARLLRGQGGEAAPQRQPVEQLPRRTCAAGLNDSRASRATRATRGDAHPARRSAHWQYCTSQHGVEQCIQGIVLGASQHASAQSKSACCAPWRRVMFKFFRGEKPAELMLASLATPRSSRRGKI